MSLTHAQAKKYYDWFGRKQDSQGFYEDRALDELIAHGDFARAQRVFELGCGTGRFAQRLLREYLPDKAEYIGLDISDTMVSLAQQRLAPYALRTQVIKSDGGMQFPLAEQSVDRMIATYVFDLLSEADIKLALQEAQRILRPGGKLCLISLSRGVNFSSRLVCRLWSGLFRLHAPLVGGCRPLELLPFLDQARWLVEYHHVLTQFGVPSEILIASPL